jgi:HEAT repeat protein
MPLSVRFSPDCDAPRVRPITSLLVGLLLGLLLGLVACTPPAARQARGLMDQGDPAGAEAAARQGLASDPDHEELRRLEIEAVLAGGDAGRALALYETWRTRRGGHDRTLLRRLARETLAQGLRVPSAQVRAAAIEVIERQEIIALARDVAARIEDEEDLVAAAAAIALLRSEPGAARVAAQLLGSDDPAARALVITGIGRKLGKTAATELRAALGDRQAVVRRAAVRALARVATDEDRERLAVLASTDPDLRVRTAALQALAQHTPGPAAVAAAERALARTASRPPRSTPDTAAGSAPDAMPEAAPGAAPEVAPGAAPGVAPGAAPGVAPGAAPGAPEIASGAEPGAASPPTSPDAPASAEPNDEPDDEPDLLGLHLAAVAVLGRAGRIEALQALAATASPVVAVRAAEALRGRTPSLLAEAIQRGLAETSPSVRQAVLESVRKLPADQAARLAAERALDPSWGVRLVAARVLLYLDDLGRPGMRARAVPLLEAALTGAPVRLRVQAATALAGLGDARGLDALARLSRSADAGIRESVIASCALVRARQPRADRVLLGVLARALADESPLVRILAAEILVER